MKKEFNPFDNVVATRADGTVFLQSPDDGRKKKKKKKKKFKVLIVPSSDDEDKFENADTFAKASKISADSKRVVSFATEAERKAFINGYEAMCGYMGDGFWFKN